MLETRRPRPRLTNRDCILWLALSLLWSLQAEFAFPKKNVMCWKWKEGQCFAYEGLKRIGALDHYRCGVMYRIECWLRAMDIRFRLDPRVKGCLMHERGSCEGDVLFEFE